MIDFNCTILSIHVLMYTIKYVFDICILLREGVLNVVKHCVNLVVSPATRARENLGITLYGIISILNSAE